LSVDYLAVYSACET